MDELRSQNPEEGEAAVRSRQRPVVIEISEGELKRRAAQVGAAAGHAVALLRDVRRRFEEPGQPRDDRLSELSAKAQAKTLARIDELRHRAAAQAEKWRQAALDKTAELRRQAQTKYDQTRVRARQVAHDRPLHVVLAAGVAGFLLGVALRTWRASRG